MCTTPDIPDPVPPPAPPPPPTNMARGMKSRSFSQRRRAGTRTTGVSALTVRRPSVKVGSSGTGANINYNNGL
tara:strand:- start:234 stop:452 length:219 start_codon:yes stop_codon:yes gene_type:complete